MKRVYLSLGSNIEPQHYLCRALDALEKKFGELIISPVYESEAVGFTGENFYNLALGVDTNMPVGELASYLRSIEEQNDRSREGSKFSSRTLDIDILTYGEEYGSIDGLELPRDEILKYAFVLIPLVDIAGGERHPVLQQTYLDLLQTSENQHQKLWPVAFMWQGRSLSSSN